MKSYFMPVLLLAFSLIFNSLIFAQDELPTGMSEYSKLTDEGVVYLYDFAAENNELEFETPGSSPLLSKNISAEFREKHLSEILHSLACECGTNFIFDNHLVDKGLLNKKYENKSLEQVLNDLLDEHNIGYVMVGNNKIILADKSSLVKRMGGIVGKVLDENSQPLVGANVFVEGTNLGCATNVTGAFEIKNVKPGEYNLKASFIGYKPKTEKIIVVEGKKTEISFKLVPESFNIGGIEVVGTTELLPTDVSTKTEITSGEIEHYQATSLGDVLDLVPGIQKTANPGLNKTNQVAVRGSIDDDLSAFGTSIIIDGAPESNNANLQFEALTGSKFGSNNLSGGVDLRTIPADNIESIEVISGLPSVRYGDFTNGIIELKTKTGKRPNRFKFKNNPHTSEGNFGGGIGIGTDALCYNFNLARSERDIRITGDEYTRYTGQLVYKSLMFDKRWKSHYKLRAQVIQDEEEPEGDLTKTNNYNRGFSVGFNTWGTYKKNADDVSSFDYNAYVKMKRINSRKQKLVTDFVITPDNDTLAAYTGVLENKGIQWTAGGRIDWNKIFFTGSFIHKILIGAQLQYDANTGDGIIIDTLFNYYGVDSRRRPYSFDEIPGQDLWSFYAEDKITGKLFFDFSMVVGFRYEMYRPFGFNFSGLWGDGDFVKAHQGSFFNPRFSLLVYLSKVSQFRLTAGKSSKSPPMNMIYPREDVFEWRNPFDGSINYSRYDRTVPNLRGYQSTQYEVSYDHKFFNRIGTTVSAYYKERTGQPVGEPIPVFEEYQSESGPKVYFIDEYSLSRNWGKYYSKGLEFSLRTAKIKPLNLNFTLTGSYNRSKNPGSSFNYDSTPDETKGQYANYQVPGVSVDTLIGWTYKNSGRWQDQVQLNYYFKYTNHELGLWVTLRVEQLLKEREQRFDLEPVNKTMLTDEALVSRTYDESIKTKPNKFLFNFNVSKSLFDGAEMSFYVNNFLDDPAIRRYYNISSGREVEEVRNPDLFYGIEFSMIIDKIFN